MAATTEGRGTKEKLENQENDSLTEVEGKNELPVDELYALLIQKECELLSLRCKLEMHKNTDIKPGGDQATSNDEEEGHSIKQIQGFGDIYTESYEPNTTYSRITSFFKKNCFPTTSNEAQGVQEQSIQESQLQEIYQALNEILNEIKTKIQAQIREERLELKRQKEELNEKELKLQKERSDLENLRYQLEDEKNRLGNDKRKIEIELRNLLDDESEWDMNEEGKHSENWGEHDMTGFSEISHSERIVDCEELPIENNETRILEEKIDSDTLETEKEKYQQLTLKVNGKNVIEMEAKVKPSENLENELLQLAEAKADEIILVQEEKISELEYFMDTWKKTVEDERKIMHYQIENREKVGHQIRESCQVAVKNISREWTDIKEAYKTIQAHQAKLYELESGITRAKLELDQKEIIYKEGFTKIQNEKNRIEEHWKYIRSEKDKIEKERNTLNMDKKKLQESREFVERQRYELEKTREIFREEVRVGEEIQKKVDEKRTSGIIEEQRNLVEKREMLMSEHHDLYKARQICDAHRAVLEWERMCIAREKDEVQDQRIELEKEKMALGIIKATNDEKMMMIETNWKKIKDKEHEIENQFKELEEERKCISDERISLQSERFYLDELKTTVLTRVSEINTEISQVEQQKKDLLSMTSLIDKKKSELDAEWEALKLEKKECMKMAERTGESQTSWQDYRLKHCEMVKSIKNRILSLVEEVTFMEDGSLDEATQYSQNNRLHQQDISDINKKSEQGINAPRLDEDYLTQRIKHLVNAVKSMEKDMQKMKYKINRRQQLKKKVTTLKKQVKKMRGQISNLQENLKEKSEINFNAIDMMNRFMHPYQESLMTRVDNRKCDACKTITSIKNIMTMSACKMAGDWKSNCFPQQKYCHKCLKSIQILENHNANLNNKQNDDSWGGEMINGKKFQRDLNNEQLKCEDETLFEETPYSHINCWMKAKDKRKEFLNIDREFKKHEQLAFVRESENERKSHFFSSINTSWGMRPESDLSPKQRKEKSAWNLAFLIAIILSYGATSVFISSS